jgi:hypothetical protein
MAAGFRFRKVLAMFGDQHPVRRSEPTPPPFAATSHESADGAAAPVPFRVGSGFVSPRLPTTTWTPSSVSDVPGSCSVDRGTPEQRDGSEIRSVELDRVKAIVHMKGTVRTFHYRYKWPGSTLVALGDRPRRPRDGGIWR